MSRVNSQNPRHPLAGLNINTMIKKSSHKTRRKRRLSLSLSKLSYCIMILSSALPRNALVRALNSTSFRPAAKEALHRSRAYITTKPISSSRCLCTLTSSSHTMIKHEHKRYNSPDIQLVQKRSNFSFAGPRKLSDILKVELLKDKSNTEISDMWMTYHEGKEKVHGIVMDGKKGRNLLSKAAQW